MTRTKKRMLGVAAVVAAIVTTGVGIQAYAASIMHMRTYYTDATLTTVSGMRMDSCNNGRLSQRPVVGTVTPYYIDEPVGSCPGGYW